MRLGWVLGVVTMLLQCQSVFAGGAGTAVDSTTRAASRASSPQPARSDSALESGPGHWFYSGLPYGSDAQIHPVRLILNGGFGTLQFNNRSNRIADIRLRQGWQRVGEDLGTSASILRHAGWSEFLETEVIPVSFNRRNAQYWPNYTLHLIGGGMSSTMMREWFAQRGFAHPELGSFATLTAYHLLNEAVEASSRTGPSTDAIADLMLFDPAGWLLFQHEGVNGFFSRTLHMRDWSSQIAIDPVTGTLENNGQNFSMKIGLPSSDHWSLFYYFGNHGELGLSCRGKNGSAISMGAGLKAARLVDLDNGAQTADLVPCAGLFYDRNGSLLLSVMTAKASRYDMQVNAYPGLIRLRSWTAGLFFNHARTGGNVMGVSLTRIPIGLATHRGPTSAR